MHEYWARIVTAGQALTPGGLAPRRRSTALLGRPRSRPCQQRTMPPHQPDAGKSSATRKPPCPAITPRPLTRACRATREDGALAERFGSRAITRRFPDALRLDEAFDPDAIQAISQGPVARDARLGDGAGIRPSPNSRAASRAAGEDATNARARTLGPQRHRLTSRRDPLNQQRCSGPAHRLPCCAVTSVSRYAYCS